MADNLLAKPPIYRRCHPRQFASATTKVFSTGRGEERLY
jgi:hypothetical protein